MVAFAVRFKKKKERKRPEWLEELLKKKFFEICDEHRDLRKSEVNTYCIDCDRCMCPHCLASPTASPQSGDCYRLHRLLQIRRYVYQDVVRVLDVHKLVDCSRIQPYTVNSAKVVLLKPRRQTKASKSATASCKMCGRGVADPYRYCSIACKVSPRVAGESVPSSGVDDEGPTSVAPSRPSIPSAVADPEVSGDSSLCLSSPLREPSDSSVVVAAEYHKPCARKGVPRRSPFF